MCQDRVLYLLYQCICCISIFVVTVYLLYQYIETVIVLVHQVIIAILSVLSTFLVVSGPWEGRVPGKGESLGRVSSQAIPMLRAMGVILRWVSYCGHRCVVGRQAGFPVRDKKKSFQEGWDRGVWADKLGLP